MGNTARYRMSRYLRSAPVGEVPATGGGGAPATAPVTAAVPATGAPGQTAPPVADQPLGEAGLRALQSERDARKEAEHAKSEMEKQLAALKDQRPADQKLADQLADITKQLAAERVERLRSQTALKHSISADYLPLLTAATADELEAQGVLVANLQKAAMAAAAPNTPGHLPHPGQGAPSSGEPSKKTLQDGAATYAARVAASRPTPPASST